MLCAFASLPLQAHQFDSKRADSHAPISVMGDHTHAEGEMMVSYRFMQMQMEGLQDNKNEFSLNEFLASDNCTGPAGCSYANEMTMDMHMFGFMYAPSNSTTLVAMLNYLDNSMEMTMKMGGMGNMGAMDTMTDMGTMDTMAGMNDMSAMDSMDGMAMKKPMLMTMKSSGLGDTKLGALQNIYQTEYAKLHLNLILSLPTGSIDEESESGMRKGKRLAYMMQLGSGSYDFEPGITWNQQFESFSYGAQAKAVLRLNDNKHDYRLGDRFKIQSWVQVPFLDHFSASARIAWEQWGDIDGEDKEIGQMKPKNPLADPDNAGMDLLSAGLGLNAVVGGGHRLAAEYTLPLEQKSNGLQMTREESVTLAWQFAF
jgi:hypothetical protein